MTEVAEAVEKTTVTVISQDGMEYEVEPELLKQANTFKNVLEGSEAATAIPLPNVRGETFEKVIEYMKEMDSRTKNPDQHSDEANQKWDDNFFKQMENQLVFELTLCANYLDFNSLLNGTCKTIAGMIAGQTPEYIRQLFNIQNDFTPEEEAQVRKENEWCEDR